MGNKVNRRKRQAWERRRCWSNPSWSKRQADQSLSLYRIGESFAHVVLPPTDRLRQRSLEHLVWLHNRIAWHERSDFRTFYGRKMYYDAQLMLRDIIEHRTVRSFHNIGKRNQ